MFFSNIKNNNNKKIIVYYIYQSLSPLVIKEKKKYSKFDER